LEVIIHANVAGKRWEALVPGTGGNPNFRRQLRARYVLGTDGVRDGHLTP